MDLRRRLTAAEANLVKGAKQVAARGYSSLVEYYGSKLHPQHATLFNAHTILAGILASQGGRALPRVGQPLVEATMMHPVTLIWDPGHEAEILGCTLHGSLHAWWWCTGIVHIPWL